MVNKITKGEWIVNIDRICDKNGYTISSSCYRNNPENIANAKLIADAGTTANKCNKLPSVLLQ